MLHSHIVLAQQSEDREQAITPGLMAEAAVTLDHLQQLFHGPCVVILGHFNGALQIPCLQIIGIIGDDAFQYFSGRGLLSKPDQAHVRAQIAYFREFAGGCR